MSRTNRSTTVVNLKQVDVVNFTIEIAEPLVHTPRSLTPTKRLKMLRARREARNKLVPMVFGDSCLFPEKDKHLDAIKDKFDVLTFRGVLTHETNRILLVVHLFRVA